MFKISNNTKYDFVNDEKIILRDYLALERTRLANSRTLLSFIRTSLYMFLGGMGFLELKSLQDYFWVAYLLFSIGVFIFFYGIVSYFIFKKKFDKYYEEIDLN
jgi:putative membrane protein